MSDFDGKPPSNSDENSMAAAESMEPHAHSVRRLIWLQIGGHPEGLACWEIEQILGLLHQTASPAIRWLWQYDWLVRVGKNKTPSNRSAWVYRAQRGRTP